MICTNTRAVFTRMLYLLNRTLGPYFKGQSEFLTKSAWGMDCSNHVTYVFQKVVKVKTPRDLWMAKNLTDMKLWFLSESMSFIYIQLHVYVCVDTCCEGVHVYVQCEGVNVYTVHLTSAVHL